VRLIYALAGLQILAVGLLGVCRGAGGGGGGLQLKNGVMSCREAPLYIAYHTIPHSAAPPPSTPTPTPRPHIYIPTHLVFTSHYAHTSPRF